MRVGLIGYGKMGRGIFSLLADSPLQATVFLRDPAKCEEHNRKLEKRLERAVRNGLIPADDLPRHLAAYRFTADWEDLAPCELLIETAKEDFDLKVELLQRLERTVGDAAVISTNSSSFSPTKLGEHLQRPERFCGFHFFHPIQLTSIAEIIIAGQTSPETVEAVRQASLALGRRPLLVKDYSGSAINVMLTGLSCEALYILEQGLALPSRVDAIAGQFARLGPCEAIDNIGIRFFTDVLRRTLEAFPFKLTIPELCLKLIHDGRDGKYAGKGLFVYRDDRPGDDAPEYYVIPNQTHSPPGTPDDDASLLERMRLQIYYNVLTLAELEVGSLEDLCFGIEDLIGMKESPLEQMHALGGAELKARLLRHQEVFGPRFDPEPISKTLDRLSSGEGAR